MLVCIVVQNVSVCFDLKHVLKFCVDDEIDCIGEWLSEVEFHSQVTLFYKLKMISRTVIWGQIKCK